MLEFINGQVDFEQYQKQIIQILSDPDREVLYQLGFDFFDSSNDDKISILNISFAEYYLRGEGKNEAQMEELRLFSYQLARSGINVFKYMEL